MLTDEPKAYGSNWHAATRVESPARARLTVEADVDVCVIGGGLAGLTVAREVARLGWSVVVLEGKSIAWSASGRNAGVVLPGFAVGADALIERVGLDRAKALWARSEAGADYVRSAARDMPGVALSENGWLHVSQTDRTAAIAHEAALLAGEFGVAVEPWAAERVHEALQSPRYFHGLHYPRGFCLHPLNYALGLAAAAEALGARIFEDTPVLEIDPAGVRKRIVTNQSRVRAAHVVLAGDVHLAGLMPELSSTLLPIFSTVIVTAPLGDALHEAIRYPGAISDSEASHHRVLDGGRLMWSGRSAVRLGSPRRDGNALRRRIGRTYPQLSKVDVEYAWTGVTGHTVHGMPQIGEVRPGLWLLSGFGGHGLNTTAMAGEMIARAIVESDPGWQMFSPFALVWAGGRYGRAAQRVSEWSRRSREALGGMLARGRAARRKRKDAVKVATVPPAAPPVIEPLVAAAEAIAVPIEHAPVPVPAPVPESAPAAAADEIPRETEILEGQSGAAAPTPEPEPVAPAQPPGRKRKRGKRRKGGGMPPS